MDPAHEQHIIVLMSIQEQELTKRWSSREVPRATNVIRDMRDTIENNDKTINTLSRVVQNKNKAINTLSHVIQHKAQQSRL
jgi:hypothetical protein